MTSPRGWCGAATDPGRMGRGRFARPRRLERRRAVRGPITGIGADSRVVGAGDLFVALNTGVAYVDEAAARGAATLVPDDQEAALAALASLVRSKSDARVVAVVGSTGQDVDEGHPRRALQRRRARRSGRTRARTTRSAFRSPSAGSSRRREILVTEMGMRGLGQIAELCEVARPAPRARHARSAQSTSSSSAPSSASPTRTPRRSPRCRRAASPSCRRTPPSSSRTSAATTSRSAASTAPRSKEQACRGSFPLAAG